LKLIWAVLNGPAGKRLAPFMGEIVEALERAGELQVSPEVRGKLMGVSAATIDRMLAPERARLRVKGRSGTKPGSILKRQIPIRTFAEWDEALPGFCEMDLVAHDGGDGFGEFCQTLDLTCVATGWTECRAVKNKAQRWCFDALLDIGPRSRSPCSAWTRTTGASSSTTSSTATAPILHRARHHGHPVTALPKEPQLLRRARRTGRWSAKTLATPVTTHRQSSKS
jgi:hypothetical protein